MNKSSVKRLSPRKEIPVVAIVGKSDVGKTTLIEKLIPEFKRRGYKVGTIKHDVHGFVMDQPGKDSWRHKEAGASMVVISSPRQMAMVKDVDQDTGLDELTGWFSGVDIILAEGYKRTDRPKLEVFRPDVHPEPACRNDPNLLGFVTDAPVDSGVPRFSMDDIRDITQFLIDRFGLETPWDGNSREAIS